MIVTLLIILHVITASAWFGLSLRLGNQAKFAATGQPAVAMDGSRTMALMGIMLIATFIFSMTLLVVGGGYPGLIQYHIASALIVVLLALQFMGLRPSWSKLSNAVNSGPLGDDASDDVSSRLSRKISMFAGIGHLIWLILLVLMFWNRLSI
ncbi:MAG: hypothetical protein OXF84_04330 [Bacteroidetes bacterium]|nr:hypothetical protein [Bacteroidota bacterium]